MIVAGVFFLIFGLLGLALPFLQGIFFLAIGVVLLSLASTTIRKWIEQRTRKYPKIHIFVERIENWVVGIIGRAD